MEGLDSWLGIDWKQIEQKPIKIFGELYNLRNYELGPQKACDGKNNH